jgi:hypothetical protein
MFSFLGLVLLLHITMQPIATLRSETDSESGLHGMEYYEVVDIPSNLSTSSVKGRLQPLLKRGCWIHTKLTPNRNGRGHVSTERILFICPDPHDLRQR